MNLTLQVIITPANHTLSDPAKNARRYATGDVVDIFNADVVSPFNGTDHILRDVISDPRFVFVHVRGVPDRTLGRIKDTISTPDIEYVLVNGEPVSSSYHRRRKFALLASSVPTAMRNRLMADRQITVTWTQAKNYVRHVRENRLITDADL